MLRRLLGVLGELLTCFLRFADPGCGVEVVEGAGPSCWVEGLSTLAGSEGVRAEGAYSLESMMLGSSGTILSPFDVIHQAAESMVNW